MYSYNTTLGTKPAPVDCQFLDCATGMYNYDKGINALGCSFNACDDGLVCEQMAQTSMLTDCTAANNTGTGVRVQGSSVLGVLNPAFDHNSIGMDVSGATAAVACGSVSHNGDHGFFIHDGATLRLDIDLSGPHDPVTAVENGVTIFCDLANNVYLDQGFNSLKPVVIGQQNTLQGTFLCQPYNANQLARSNNWNGSVGVPLTSADYAITACNGNLTFVDPSSSAETVCDDDNHLQQPGGAEQAGAMAPAAMAYCPDCALVEGMDGLPLPLNTASVQAMALGLNDSLPNNELLALEAFHALLADPVAEPNEAEKFLLAYDHNLMVESYGDALAKGQLTTTEANAELDSYLTAMTEIQDARISAATPGDQDAFIFQTRVERAQFARAAGKLEEALARFQAIPPPASVQEQALLATLLCWTQTEWGLTNGTYTWDEVEAAMLVCGGHGNPKLVMQVSTTRLAESRSALPGLEPNPASSQVQVQGYAGEPCTVRILDITGRVVVPETRFESSTVLPLHHLRPGTYVCRIATVAGRTWSGRLVVGM